MASLQLPLSLQISHSHRPPHSQLLRLPPSSWVNEKQLDSYLFHPPNWSTSQCLHSFYKATVPLLPSKAITSTWALSGISSAFSRSIPPRSITSTCKTLPHLPAYKMKEFPLLYRPSTNTHFLSFSSCKNFSNTLWFWMPPLSHHPSHQFIKTTFVKASNSFHITLSKGSHLTQPLRIS